MHVGNLLRRRLICHVPLMAIGFFVLYYIFGESYNPSISTLHYLYSSLLQGFAALAGLLLAILGFNYKYLKNANEVHRTDAVQAAVHVLHRQPQGYEDYIRSAKQWFNTEYSTAISDMTSQLGEIRDAYEDPSDPAHASEDNVAKLSTLFGPLRNSTHWYREYVSHLARFIKSDNELQVRLPANIISAVGPTFAVIFLSILSLGTSDYSIGNGAFGAMAIIYVSAIALSYSALFFRSMLGTLFGGGRIEGFKETGLPRPNNADAILDEVRKTMRWT